LIGGINALISVGSTRSVNSAARKNRMQILETDS
jgi:hypothetical protein